MLTVCMGHSTRSYRKEPGSALQPRSHLRGVWDSEDWGQRALPVLVERSRESKLAKLSLKKLIQINTEEG